MEFLNSLHQSGHSLSHNLLRKKVACIMSLCKLYPPELCYGTWLAVRISSWHQICNFVSKDSSSLLNCVIQMATNKTQRQTLKVVGQHPQESFISDGQLQTRCSRSCQSIQRSSLSLLMTLRQPDNIVYPICNNFYYQFVISYYPGQRRVFSQ